MGQCVQKARRAPDIDQAKLGNSAPILSDGLPITSNHSAGDPKTALREELKDMDFLELFDDELRVLSSLANLENALLRGKPVPLDKDCLIELLQQEAQRLKAGGRCRQNSFRLSTDRLSTSSTDELKIVTRILLRLQSAAAENLVENGEAASVDSGLDEDAVAPVPSLAESVFKSSEGGPEKDGSERMLDFNEQEGREAILKGFLDDVGKFESMKESGEILSDLGRNQQPTAILRGLRQNRMTLHLFGTSRLHEELKLRPLNPGTRRFGGNSQQDRFRGSFTRLPYFPVHYKFWALIDATLIKCFTSRSDRRILATSRKSGCIIQLLSPIRKNANGMDVQQISIQAPSLEALERCCSILDDDFPQFNAGMALQKRDRFSIDVRFENESELLIEEEEVDNMASLDVFEASNHVADEEPGTQVHVGSSSYEVKTGSSVKEEVVLDHIISKRGNIERKVSTTASGDLR